MCLLYSSRFLGWQEAGRIGCEKGGPVVVGMRVLVRVPACRILLRCLRKLGDCERWPCSRSSQAHIHPVLPATGGDVRVSYWPSLEHLEIGGSVHKCKLARIINDPGQLRPWVFPWSFSCLGIVSCCFLGCVLPGTFRAYRTLLSFSFWFLCFLRFSASSFSRFSGAYRNHSTVSSCNSGSWIPRFAFQFENFIPKSDFQNFWFSKLDDLI